MPRSNSLLFAQHRIKCETRIGAVHVPGGVNVNVLTGRELQFENIFSIQNLFPLRIEWIILCGCAVGRELSVFLQSGQSLVVVKENIFLGLERTLY